MKFKQLNLNKQKNGQFPWS